jgi:membrane protein
VRVSLRKYSKRKRSDAAIRRQLRRYREMTSSTAPPLSHSSKPNHLPIVVPKRDSWRYVAVAVYNRIFEDEVFGRAAQLSYYWLFSLFPLLIFLTALLAYVPLPHFFEDLFAYLQKVLPPDAFSMVDTTFTQIRTQPRSGLLSFGILLSIWVASSGMEAIISALNTAYDVPDRRAWWRERLLAIVLICGFAVFIIFALALLFLGGIWGERIAAAYGYGGTFDTVWQIVRWVGIIGFLMFALDLLYYTAPNIKQRWRVTTPGALFALGGWLIISFGFKFYVARFGRYNATYGALGGVMLLMLWFYFTGVAILIGGEINSVMAQIKRESAVP